MSEVVGKTCPYCQFPVKPGEESVVCSACGLAHHAGCWEENGKCTTYGCNGQPAAPRALPPPLGGVDLSSGVERCPRCGLENAPDANFCKACGATIAPAAATEPAVDKLSPGAYPLSYPRASRWSRFLASLIDGLIGGWLVLLGMLSAFLLPGVAKGIYIVGVLWSLYYGFSKDGWAGGRSIGKRALGLMVVHLATNRPGTKRQSVVRQLVFMLNYAPSIVASFAMGFNTPVLQAFQIGASRMGEIGSNLSIAVFVIECCLVLFSAGGRRVGDRLAGTQVIEYKDYRP